MFNFGVDYSFSLGLRRKFHKESMLVAAAAAAAAVVVSYLLTAQRSVYVSFGNRL